MSLADQSQQWYPTSVQVTVHEARNLRIKGKNGTNDAYAIFQMAKDKFSTSVAERCVVPMWKEEASFDLPLFHPNNAERCTLHIIIMHRAHVGLDKFLGQAIINLLDLHDNKSREKTDWFTLVDKTGKEDKARGEVLLDIQFMRNNMSASMFDLSMQDKPRSRISKLKDKVRGKRKDGFSDSASAIVPSSQVLTDSEGEADAQSLNQSAGVKKKSKLKTLFAPKTNLQRNVSQSMSTLGTLPEKNSSLTGSRSSGLNVDSPDVKKKFKFLGHKRTGSNDSKVSQGPFSLLGRSKQSNNDPNSLCINGNHVYAEEAEPQSGSTLSLNSSGQGSAEDVRRPNADSPTLEQQRHQEEEQKRRAEESHRVEAKRLEEEKRRAEAQRLREDEERKHQEEQERRRRTAEDEAKRKKQREEEEDRRRQEEEHRRLEATENQRMEEERQRKQEEAQKAEELKRQEEASMSERLTSLFGMIRKKEEKKEEVHHPSDDKEAVPKPAPRSASKHLEVQSSHHATIPFEETPLSSEGQNPFDEEQAGHPKPSRTQQSQSAMVILNRTAKVSAVKPRLADFVSPEPSDIQSHIEQCPSSPTTPQSTLSSVPSESLVMFSSLHSSLAPPKTKTSSSDSPSDDIANLSFVVSSPTMSETKQRAPLPPNHVTYRTHAEVSALQEQPSRSVSGSKIEPIREFENPAYYDAGLLRGKRPPLPLPDYESLFPQKRHGVQGHTRWDHLIAEVSQKQREHPDEFLGKEMSVDDPEVHVPNPKSSLSPESTTVLHHKAYPQETKPSSSKKVVAPLPPKPVVSTPPRTLSDLRQKQSLVNSQITQSVESPISVPLVSGSNDTETSSRKVQSIMPDSGEVQSMMRNNSVRKVLRPPTMADDQISIQSTERTGQPNHIGDTKIESSTLLNQKAYPQDTKQSSSKKVAAPLPPKPVVSTPSRTLSDLRQKQSLVNSQITQSVENHISVPLVSGSNDTETSSRKVQSIMPDSGEVQSMMRNNSVRKVLRPPTMADDQISIQSTERSRQPNHIGDSKLEQAMPNTIAKEMLTAKPRQKAGSNESIKQADSDKNLTVSVNTLKSNNPNVSNTVMCNMDIDEANENIFKSDPFPSGDLLSRDPWAQLENNHSVDYLFTGRVQTEQRLADQGMADDNLAKYFTTNKPTDPFSAFDDSDSGKHTGHKKQFVGQNSPVSQSRHSQRRNQTPQSLSNVVIKDDKAHQEATPKQDLKITAVQKTMPASAIKGDYLKLQDPFGAGPFVLHSTSPMSSLKNTSEPFHVAMEDSPYQLEGLSEGKTPLRAWVSPSEVNVLNNNGGGLASTPRRPHPVKPMSSFENQFSNSTPAVREVHDTTTAKQKATESVESGPYTQLTQEELITLVVKQQTELSKKDAKISELEEYIDNLLVRVIEEKPSILLSLNSGKPK